MPSRLERSFWGEKVCGFQTKKVGRRFQIVLFLYRLAAFYAKKTKRDLISTHKEGKLDIFDRVVFLVEMGKSA